MHHMGNQNVVKCLLFFLGGGTCDPCDGDAAELRVGEPDEESSVLALVQAVLGLLAGDESQDGTGSGKMHEKEEEEEEDDEEEEEEEEEDVVA